MKRRYGQALSEYCMVGGLVIVASIGALMLLGSSISALFNGFSASYTSKGTGSILQPLAGSNPSSPVTPAVSTQTPTAPPVVPKMTASFDPKTGMVVLTGLDSGTGGKTTTSSQGSEAAALALSQLAQQLAEKATTPEEQNLASLIGKLATQGHQLAAGQANLSANAPMPTDQQLKDPNYINSATFKTYYDNIAGPYPEFANLYKQIAPMTAKDPALAQQIQDYAGVIYSITSFNYIAQYQPVDASGTPVTTAMLQNDIQSVGVTDISTTPLTVALKPIEMQTSTVAVDPSSTTGQSGTLQGVGSTQTDLSSGQIENIAKNTP